MSVEAETAVSSAARSESSGATTTSTNKRFQTVDARFKYYPGEVAMQGFAIGLSVGYTKFNGELVVPVSAHLQRRLRGRLEASTLWAS